MLLLLLVAPLVGAAGASGVEPFNPGKRATETETDTTMFRQVVMHYDEHMFKQFLFVLTFAKL